MVLVNPEAGSGQGRKMWPEIEAALKMQSIDFEVFFSEAPGQLFDLADQAYVHGWRDFIAVGGDGSLSEMLNGIANAAKGIPEDVCLALIPAGTGNDWQRTMRLPEKFEDIIQLIKNRSLKRQDVGLLQMDEASKGTNQRYFLNIAGLGFDAFVSKRLNKMKESNKKGRLAYLWQLATGLFSYRAKPAKVSIDGEQLFQGDIFSLSAGICQYNGGGMRQLPDADPFDGLLDVTLIPEISKMKVIAQLKNLYSGAFVREPEILQFKCKELFIECDSDVLIEADGEDMGSGSCHISLRKAAVQVVCGL